MTEHPCPITEPHALIDCLFALQVMSEHNEETP
jgi:hypothetical protein